jgi:hypothetical protein
MKNIAASFALASALYLLPAVSHSAKAQGFGSGFADSFAAGGALVTQDQSARQERAQYRRPTLTSGEQFAFNLLKVGLYGCFGLVSAQPG